MDKSFKPTVDWMGAKYDELNKRLFSGDLDRCNFGIFTSGKGSEGRTLGRFRLTGSNLKAERYSRRMFTQTFDGKLYVNKKNFYDVCKPLIEINGNYSGAESSFTNTLVHEMCHYYDYMYGTLPKQSHGPSFRNIAMYISDRSNGEFTIQRLASAEVMEGYELNDAMKAKKERRKANLASKLCAIFIFTKQGSVHLCTTSSEKLIGEIKRIESKRGSKVVLTRDPKMIWHLIEQGYKANFKTYRFWDVTNKGDIVKMLDTCQNEEISESKKNTMKELIREIIDEFISKDGEDNGVVTISSNMNLGLMSPLDA